MARNDWVPGAGMTFHQILEAFRVAIEGKDVKDKMYWMVKHMIDTFVEGGNANFEVKLSRGRFKDLASRLDAGDADMRNISVDWINKNLGKLDQSFMSEEFLQQMAGTTPINAVPAKGSITTQMLSNESVTREKASFIGRAETKKDIYEKIKLSDYQNLANDGKVLTATGGSAQSGVTSTFTYTDLIEVEGGADYAMSYRNVVIYGADGSVIAFLDNSGYSNVLLNKRVITLPDSATHIAISLDKNRVTTDTIERLSPIGTANLLKVKNVAIDATDTTFARYGDTTVRDIYETIEISKFTDERNNGKVLVSNGTASMGQYTTDFTFTNIIPINANATYALYYRNLLVFSVNGTIIDFVDNSGYHPSLNNKVDYTMPSNASHIVVTLDINRAKTDTIERITPLDRERSVIIDDLKISPNNTDFAYYADEDKTVYEMIKVAPYKNSNNDGKVLSGAGMPQETQYTTDLTYTEKIPVLSGGLYYVDSRSFVVFNDEQQVIGYFDNPGYSAVNSLKKEYRLPNNSKFVVLNVAIEKVNTLTMERLSPNEDETPIKIKNLKVPKVDLKGKNILVLGDSLNANYANNISDFIQKLTGATVFNGALGGARLSTKTGNSENAPTGSEVVKYLISGNFQVLEDHINSKRTGDLLIKQLATLDVLKSVDLNELDLVILAFGTNDRLESVPIGNDTDDETKFKGALKLSIQRLQSAYPHLQVMLVSQPYSYQHDGGGAYYDENTANLAGHVIADYVKAMEEVAEKYHVHFLDNYTNGGINEFNKDFYFNSNDGIHGKQESFVPHLAVNYVNKLSQIY